MKANKPIKMSIDTALIDFVKAEGQNFQNKILDFCEKNNYDPMVAMEILSYNGKAMSRAADEIMEKRLEEVLSSLDPRNMQ